MLKFVLGVATCAIVVFLSVYFQPDSACSVVRVNHSVAALVNSPEATPQNLNERLKRYSCPIPGSTSL